MVTSVALYLGFLAATGAERLAEVRTSLRNAAWSFARGGVEYGQGHYPAMVALHTGFLFACAAEVVLLQRAFVPWLGWPMLVTALGCQAMRAWILHTLGPRWNTRVIIVPGLPRVTAGPYRWLNHPNYVVVAAEGIALPMIHTAWITAAVFTVLNALLLRTRLAVEDAALRTLPEGPA